MEEKLFLKNKKKKQERKTYTKSIKCMNRPLDIVQYSKKYIILRNTYVCTLNITLDVEIDHCLLNIYVYDVF